MKGSRRWFRQWCETINTRSPKSLHGHRKYRGCHWDRKKYNWALRVRNVWVQCTAYRHLFLCGTHILSGVWTCMKSEQNHMCGYRTASCFIKGEPRKPHRSLTHGDLHNHCTASLLHLGAWGKMTKRRCSAVYLPALIKSGIIELFISFFLFWSQVSATFCQLVFI